MLGRESADEADGGRRVVARPGGQLNPELVGGSLASANAGTAVPENAVGEFVADHECEFVVALREAEEARRDDDRRSIDVCVHVVAHRRRDTVVAFRDVGNPGTKMTAAALDLDPQGRVGALVLGAHVDDVISRAQPGLRSGGVRKYGEDLRRSVDLPGFAQCLARVEPRAVGTELPRQTRPAGRQQADKGLDLVPTQGCSRHRHARAHTGDPLHVGEQPGGRCFVLALPFGTHLRSRGGRRHRGRAGREQGGGDENQDGVPAGRLDACRRGQETLVARSDDHPTITTPRREPSKPPSTRSEV